jgi:UDPglucose 6-dehydrogenase
VNHNIAPTPLGGTGQRHHQSHYQGAFIMNQEKRILCIGAGYVGGPTMAVIASRCPQYRVTVVDVDEAKIAAWNSDRLPIYEPGLDDIVSSANFGAGAGMASDLQYLEQVARMILEHAESPKIVIEKSTLPVKTAQALERILGC